MKVKFINRSICPCGFSILKESIPLGAEYDVDGSNRKVMTLICGGCHTRHEPICIYVHEKDGSHGGFLPEAIFEMPKDKAVPFESRITSNPHCPHCGRLLDGATGVGNNEAKPYPGAVTLCIYCCEFCIFTESLQLRAAEVKDFVNLSEDNQRYLTWLQQTVRKYKAEHKIA